ncbi:hypothetical protein [Mesorhizobium sp. CO1-1-8]|uniref:hypothetical protein n=1 Tax=Mesorhizobium sp. CO1-1-8 TaxID=2876631 RepID=UPI001CD044DC|nr:hypothetical protein [Mesorhizobium sp. CO1-1-8]MBZ9774987.1 hypothetical protein [Mesorhizobium sp. CO1-1-8]
MHRKGFISPAELTTIAGVLNDYCKARGIAADCAEREDFAAHVLAMFIAGRTNTAELRQALAGGSLP